MARTLWYDLIKGHFETGAEKDFVLEVEK